MNDKKYNFSLLTDMRNRETKYEYLTYTLSSQMISNIIYFFKQFAFEFNSSAFIREL